METHLAFNISKHEPSIIYAAKFSPDSGLIAVGRGDGFVSIYDENLSKEREFECKKTENLPISSLKWRPPHGLSKNILLVGTTEGSLYHHHASSGKCISHLDLEGDEQALCVDYSPDGDHFVVGCRSPVIHVYDEVTQSLVRVLRKHGETPGHANRICSLVYFRENLVVSGGWDNNIYLWDTRDSSIVRSFNGVNLESDSLDAFGDHLLSADCSMHDQMKVWSLSDGRLIYSNSFETDGKVMKGYTAQYCKNPSSRRMFIGGSGKTQGYFMNRIGYQIVSTVDGLTSPIYCSDFATSGEGFVVGLKDGSVSLMHHRGIL